MAEQDKGTETETDESTKKYLDRLTGVGKWSLTLFAAAGSFAVGRFAFDRFGERPVPIPTDRAKLGQHFFFSWPGGELWALLAAVGFALAVTLALTSVIWVIRSSRVSTAYLLKNDPGPVQKRVQEAIRAATHLYQIPISARDAEIDEMVADLDQLVAGQTDTWTDLIDAAAARAANAWAVKLAAPAGSDPPAEEIAIAVGSIHPGRDRSADVDAINRGGQDRITIARLLERAPLAAWLTGLIDAVRLRRPNGEQQSELAHVLEPSDISTLIAAVESDHALFWDLAERHAVRLSRTLQQTASDTRAKVRVAFANGLPELGGTFESGDVRDELRHRLEPKQMTLQEFQVAYATAIRLGDTKLAQQFKVRQAVLLDTAANERTQAVGTWSFGLLLFAAPLAALSASLFVFTVRSANQLRDVQKAFAAADREDEVRRDGEATEGPLVATGATAGFLRLPLSLGDGDPWSDLGTACGFVSDDSDQRIGARPVPAIVISIGAAPVTGNVRVATGSDGNHDPDAVLRIVTQQTTDCQDTYEGWVPAAWVSIVAPEATPPSPAVPSPDDGTTSDTVGDAEEATSSSSTG